MPALMGTTTFGKNTQGQLVWLEGNSCLSATLEASMAMSSSKGVTREWS